MKPGRSYAVTPSRDRLIEQRQKLCVAAAHAGLAIVSASVDNPDDTGLALKAARIMRGESVVWPELAPLNLREKALVRLEVVRAVQAWLADQDKGEGAPTPVEPPPDVVCDHCATPHPLNDDGTPCKRPRPAP